MIRRIFGRSPQGRGFAASRKGSTRDGVPARAGPRLGHDGRARDGVPRRSTAAGSSGQDAPDGPAVGREVKARPPRAEWLTLEAPDLRIVPEEAVASRARAARPDPADLRAAGGRSAAVPRPASRRGYLLSGFVRLRRLRRRDARDQAHQPAAAGPASTTSATAVARLRHVRAGALPRSGDLDAAVAGASGVTS